MQTAQNNTGQVEEPYVRADQHCERLPLLFVLLVFVLFYCFV